MSRFLKTIPAFAPQAEALRADYMARYEDPRSTKRERFLWDYWYVPGQYHHLRTPAWEAFDAKLYEAFHEHLVLWGRRTLGCWDISPTWLSLYVEGCEQQLHADVPHGPWAFVFSLTPAERRFQGGETLILKPETLSYWSHFSDAEDRERGSFLELVAPEFNQLTVFDPRFPHGVSRVSGTHDPREGRLVIHGWFTEPRPFVEGALSDEAVEQGLGEGLAGIADVLAGCPVVHGMLSLRIDVAASGEVTGVERLADTLISIDGPDWDEDEDDDEVTETGEFGHFVSERLAARVAEWSFAPAEGETRITLPLLFRTQTESPTGAEDADDI